LNRITLKPNGDTITILKKDGYDWVVQEEFNLVGYSQEVISEDELKNLSLDIVKLRRHIRRFVSDRRNDKAQEYGAMLEKRYKELDKALKYLKRTDIK